MRTITTLGATVLLTILAGTSLAGENCTCRGNGEDIPEGQTVCLKTASGMKLARCERVLNNTSWKILDSDCPTAALPPGRSKLPGNG
jgi:predicted small secreted protein